MKQKIPTPEITKDLLAENWQLRWQVLEIFDQVRSKFHNHAQGSREQIDILKLGQKLLGHLNGPHDCNLHLILTAAYFLGGNNFLLLTFQQLGVDDSADFYPTLTKLKRNLINEQSGITLFDYFHALLSSNKAVERTTAIAAVIVIKLFPPSKAFTLLTTIPDSEARAAALDLFLETYPELFFNDYIFAAPRTLLLADHPELLRFIGPPLTSGQTTECVTLSNSLLNNPDSYHHTAVQTIGRLQLYQCRDLLLKQEENIEIATALAQLGDESGCLKLLSTTKFWRRSKRLAALAGLGFCNSLAAFKILRKRYHKGDRNEKTIALHALGQNLYPETLTFLISTLEQSGQFLERRLLLKLLAHHPNAKANPDTANLLARWYNDNELYPELLDALATFGYGDKWGEIVSSFKSPLRSPPQQKIALFMTRHAKSSIIRKDLLLLLTDIDWPFSFRLLTLLQPYMKGNDLKTLLHFLQECDETRELTIQERLTLGNDITNFNEALCEHLDLNPKSSNEALSRFVAELVDGNLPTKTELNKPFQELPTELKKLILGTSEFSSSSPEPSLLLLHFWKILSEIHLEGCSCLEAVVNRTRKYSGFFRQIISLSISSTIENDPDLHQPQALPALQTIIDFMRQRPHYEKLRPKIITHMNRVTRKAKDLQVYLDATQNRDLRVISIKRTHLEK